MRSDPPTAEGRIVPLRLVRNGLLAVMLVLALVAAGILGQALGSPGVPADGSADVGFARDMAAHHAQAVEMAETVRSRTNDATVRAIATDVSLTQTSQIGIMQGWLGAWRLPVGSSRPRMRWMQDGGTTGMHAAMSEEADLSTTADGRMPGMATAADLTRLRTLSGTAMDRLFLQLMVAHHLGGVRMAEAGSRLASRSEVRALAENIALSQRVEVRQMQSVLAGLPQ